MLSCKALSLGSVTAGNEGVKTLLAGTQVSLFLVTLAGSVAAAFWRIIITPIDTLKTVLQVQGAEGMAVLAAKVEKNGVMSLYDGALGTWVATLVGHYPWFMTNNFLEERIPQWGKSKTMTLLRRMFIGFCSSLVSDCVANSIRVVKTYKQTAPESLTYLATVTAIVDQDGVSGLFFRGLGIKIIANGISGMLFSVVWKLLMDVMQETKKSD